MNSPSRETANAARGGDRVESGRHDSREDNLGDAYVRTRVFWKRRVGFVS